MPLYPQWERPCHAMQCNPFAMSKFVINTLRRIHYMQSRILQRSHDGDGGAKGSRNE